MMRAVVGLLLLVCGACSHEPERVFVPAAPFHHEIEVQTAQGLGATVRVGEPLVLHARRMTGPWKEVHRGTLPSDACWVTGPPEDEEPEVADNVHWMVDPDGYATFNLGLRGDPTRTVHFTRPGQYQLRAVSKTFCSPPSSSTDLTVLVVE